MCPNNNIDKILLKNPFLKFLSVENPFNSLSHDISTRFIFVESLFGILIVNSGFHNSMNQNRGLVLISATVPTALRGPLGVPDFSKLNKRICFTAKVISKPQIYSASVTL